MKKDWCGILAKTCGMVVIGRMVKKCCNNKTNLMMCDQSVCLSQRRNNNTECLPLWSHSVLVYSLFNAWEEYNPLKTTVWSNFRSAVYQEPFFGMWSLHTHSYRSKAEKVAHSNSFNTIFFFLPGIFLCMHGIEYKKLGNERMALLIMTRVNKIPHQSTSQWNNLIGLFCLCKLQ